MQLVILLPASAFANEVTQEKIAKNEFVLLTCMVSIASSSVHALWKTQKCALQTPDSAVASLVSPVMPASVAVLVFSTVLVVLNRVTVR